MVTPDQLESKSKVKSSEKMKTNAIWEDFMEEMKYELGSEEWAEFRQDGKEREQKKYN